MTRLLFVCIASWLLMFEAHAQRKKIRNTEPELFKGTVLLRWNFTSLLDPVEPNLSFGASYHFKDAWSLGLDAGYIYQSGYYDEIKGTSGLVLRPSVRWYPGESRRAYLEGELHFKTTTFSLEDWLGRNCVEGVPAYEEYTRFKYVKYSIGANLKGGILARLTRDNRLWLETYFGAGLRYKDEFLKSEPNCCYDEELPIGPRIFFVSDTRKVVLPSLPFGFRVLVKLGKE
jgi:hypothetical protein